MKEDKARDAGKDGIRINKYIADSGLCSRREADSHIDKGLVTLNGKTARAGERVFEGDRVFVSGREIKGRDERVVIAYYKPVGVICSSKDRHAKRLVVNEIDHPARLFYAGRLDKDSEGLLLMTNDGDLTDKLMRAKNAHEKEYIVKLKEEVTEDFIRKMGEGVFLPEIEKTTRPCFTEKTGKYTFRIILTQGLNRQIRRMCDYLGYKVVKLTRVRFMNIELGDMKAGEYRYLTNKEKAVLLKLAGR
jgi:23S rRNA pseudouridine2604 synthase